MHRAAPIAFVVVTSSLASLLFAACATSEGTGVHGPQFGDASDGASGDDGGTQANDGAKSDDGGGTGDGAQGDDAADGSSGCTQGSIAVVGAGSSRFAAIATGNGAFTTQNLGGASFGSAVAVAAYGTGYLAVGRGLPLVFSSDTGATWSNFANVGIGTADEPAVAVLGTALHLVYLASSTDGGVDHKLFHGTYVNGWDSADDPVVSGVNQDFAPRAASAAAVSSKLVIAEAGDDGNLYAHTWSTSWQTVDPVGAPVDKNVIPRIVALEGAASGDAMIVYVRRVVSGTQDYKISSVVRGATTPGVWGSPLEVNDAAYTTDGLSALALSGGRVLVAWRGVSDGKPYYSLWSGSSWSAPAPFFTTGQPTLNAKPELARGICGADAVAVYPDSSGGAMVTSLRSGSWSAPLAVPSTSGASDVGIATRP